MSNTETWLTINNGVYVVTAPIFASYIHDELSLLLSKNPNIVIDLQNTVVRNEFLEKVAAWKNEGVTLLLSETVKSMVDCYIQTGYFVKLNLADEYKTWLIKLIESSGYPLMIKDGRLEKKDNTLHIVQFLDTTLPNLRYRELRSFATNPMNLRLALGESLEVWDLNTIFADDLNGKETGFRFASNEKERAILDVLVGIFNNDKRLTKL